MLAEERAAQHVRKHGFAILARNFRCRSGELDIVARREGLLVIAEVRVRSNSAYGGNFETLSAANQVAALTDLANNKPTSFNGLVPSDFFNEVFFMTWCGFLMDPLWGGNQGMVGWELTGFNGVNMGNFYGEGMTTKQLMVSTTPTRLKPASLAQFQQASGAGT